MPEGETQRPAPFWAHLAVTATKDGTCRTFNVLTLPGLKYTDEFLPESDKVLVFNQGHQLRAKIREEQANKSSFNLDDLVPNSIDDVRTAPRPPTGEKPPSDETTTPKGGPPPPEGRDRE